MDVQEPPVPQRIEISGEWIAPRLGRCDHDRHVRYDIETCYQRHVDDDSECDEIIST